MNPILSGPVISPGVVPRSIEAGVLEDLVCPFAGNLAVQREATKRSVFTGTDSGLPEDRSCATGLAFQSSQAAAEGLAVLRQIRFEVAAIRSLTTRGGAL